MRSLAGSRRLGLFCALALALALAAIGVIGGVGPAAASPARATKTLPDVLALLSQSSRLGNAAPGTKLTIGIGVQRPDPAGEHRVYQEMYDPSSALYRHFLSPRQFDARFGVKPATVAAIRAWLARSGLTVTYVDGSHDYWALSGTAAEVESLVDVRIDQYAHGRTRFYANATAPKVPASLPILAITGLNDYPTDRTAQMRSKPLRGAALRAADRPHDVTGGPGSGVETIYSPQDLWKIYDYPDVSSLINADGTSNPATLESSTVPLGQGQVAGIVASGDAGSEIDQLRLFEQRWGLPKVPVKVEEVDGGKDSTYGGGGSAASEWSLDVQAITGMAPDLKQLIIYDGSSLDQVGWYTYWADQTGGAQELNSSEFTCEDLAAGLQIADGETDPSITVEEPILEKAAMEGRTLFNASGDTGSGCDGLNGVTISPNPSVGYPCSSDYDVCVGGTVLSSAGATYPASTQGVSEDSWTYGGGGSSDYVPEAGFQDKVTAIGSDCVLNLATDEPYLSPTVCRAIPDVADFSANLDGDGYFVYLAGVPTAEGGTSLSSPLMAGQWAAIQSAAPASVQSAGGLGFADPTIYKQAAGADGCDTGTLTTAQAATIGASPCTDATYNRDFTDITQGEDAGDTTGLVGDPISTGLGTSNGEYFPTPGWDYVTGWGSLKVAGMEQDIDGDTTATDSYTGAETAASVVGQAMLQSYPDSATDTVNSVSSDLTDNDGYAGVNVTAVTLNATASTVTATLTVPQLSSGTPPDDTGGVEYYVAWLYNGTVYYLNADEGVSPGGAGSFTYTSGHTEEEPLSLTAGSGYDNTAGTAASGSADASTGQITITAPASEVGSPANCALLTVPEAFVITDGPAGQSVPEVTGDVQNISQFDGYSTDTGAAESVGDDVQVGGTGQVCAPATTPTPPTTTAPPTTTPTPTGTTKPTPASRGSVAYTIRSTATGGTLTATASSGTKITKVYFHLPIGLVLATTNLKKLHRSFMIGKGFTITRITRLHGRLYARLTHPARVVTLRFRWNVLVLNAQGRHRIKTHRYRVGGREPFGVRLTNNLGRSFNTTIEATVP